MMINKNAAENIINKIKAEVNEAGVETSSIFLKQYNYDFSVINGKEKVKVLTYFGKKGTKVLLQGNENSFIYKKIKNLIYTQKEIDFNSVSKAQENNFSFYIGTDESGKGDLFGPLVVAGFFFEEKIKENLLSIGVCDSKELSEKKIRMIAKKLINDFSQRIRVEIIEPSDYNYLYERYKNLNKLLVNIHSKVILDLASKSNCRNVIIDKFAKESRFEKLKLGSDFQVELHEKGEKYLGVAAASIIARFYFISWLDKNKIDNYFLPKGSSTEAIKFAKFILNKKNKNELKNYAKLHFKTFRR